MTETDKLQVVVITASTRHGRFGPTVTDWLIGRARRRHQLELDVVDLADTDLPNDLAEEDEPRPTAVAALSARLAAADAFIIVTPEYNHSFPAPLKAAIDWFYREWSAKPVGFVAYGRESGGLLAVTQLQQIFTELQSVAVRNSVIIPCYWEQFNADGSWPKEDSGCNREVAPMLDQIIWWGRALQAARSTHPYPS